MCLNNCIHEIVGKRISHVITSENPGVPHRQVFLVFDDGDSLEFYGEKFVNAKNIGRGGLNNALSYAKLFAGEISIYPEE